MCCCTSGRSSDNPAVKGQAKLNEFYRTCDLLKEEFPRLPLHEVKRAVIAAHGHANEARQGMWM